MRKEEDTDRNVKIILNNKNTAGLCILFYVFISIYSTNQNYIKRNRDITLATEIQFLVQVFNELRNPVS